MLSIIQNLPAHVLGIRATGEVTKNDVDTVLQPALKELVDRTGGIHYLLVLDTDVKNWDFGAWISDAIEGVKHFTKWHKIAVVTDQKSVQGFTKAFSFAVPGESKAYNADELNEAIIWVSAHDSKDGVAVPAAR